jgi:hypothetical protein
MRAAKQIVPRLIGCLIGVAGVLTIAVAAFVYTGDEHREAVTAIARQFFVSVEKASRVRHSAFNSSASPTPEGRIIQ